MNITLKKETAAELASEWMLGCAEKEGIHIPDRETLDALTIGAAVRPIDCNYLTFAADRMFGTYFNQHIVAMFGHPYPLPDGWDDEAQNNQPEPSLEAARENYAIAIKYRELANEFSAFSVNLRTRFNEHTDLDLPTYTTGDAL